MESRSATLPHRPGGPLSSGAFHTAIHHPSLNSGYYPRRHRHLPHILRPLHLTGPRFDTRRRPPHVQLLWKHPLRRTPLHKRHRHPQRRALPREEWVASRPTTSSHTLIKIRNVLSMPHHSSFPCICRTHRLPSLFIHVPPVGWSTRTPPNANAGFGNASNPNIYGGSEYGGSEGASVKGKLVNLIGATRTLMRSELLSEIQLDSGCGRKGEESAEEGGC